MSKLRSLPNSARSLDEGSIHSGVGHIHGTEVKKIPERVHCSTESDTWHPPGPGCSLTRIKFPWAHEPRIWRFKPITKVIPLARLIFLIYTYLSEIGMV